jgi:hypothetical protein
MTTVRLRLSEARAAQAVLAVAAAAALAGASKKRILRCHIILAQNVLNNVVFEPVKGT